MALNLIKQVCYILVMVKLSNFHIELNNYENAVFTLFICYNGI